MQEKGHENGTGVRGEDGGWLSRVVQREEEEWVTTKIGALPLFTVVMIRL